jgi:IclR family transcriptional regulator, acetate operon repressor
MELVRSPSRSRPLSTLQRGLRLLEIVAQERGQMTAKQLARRLDITLGTCYHLLRTLQEDGYLVRLSGGRYELNGRVAYLQDTLRSRLAPDLQMLLALRGLQERVNATTCVCGWYGNEIVLRWYLEPVRALHARSLKIGYVDNPHARASTRAMLAFLSESQIRDYFRRRPLPMLTAHTVTDVDALLIALEDVARQGFCVDQEELARGVCCVGAAYFDARGFPIGSYGVSVPRARYLEAHDELVDAVVVAAEETSRVFGYQGVYPPPSPILGSQPAAPDVLSLPHSGDLPSDEGVPHGRIG